MESFETPVTLDNSFAEKLGFIYNGRMEAKFKGNTLIQDNISFTCRNCLFWGMKLFQNCYSDKFGYSGYGVKFDAFQSQMELIIVFPYMPIIAKKIS